MIIRGIGKALAIQYRRRLFRRAFLVLRRFFLFGFLRFFGKLNEPDDLLRPDYNFLYVIRPDNDQEFQFLTIPGDEPDMIGGRDEHRLVVLIKERFTVLIHGLGIILRFKIQEDKIANDRLIAFKKQRAFLFFHRLQPQRNRVIGFQLNGRDACIVYAERDERGVKGAVAAAPPNVAVVDRSVRDVRCVAELRGCHRMNRLMPCVWQPLRQRIFDLLDRLGGVVRRFILGIAQLVLADLNGGSLLRLVVLFCNNHLCDCFRSDFLLRPSGGQRAGKHKESHQERYELFHWKSTTSQWGIAYLKLHFNTIRLV